MSARWLLCCALLAGCSFDRAGLGGGGADAPVSPGPDGPVVDGPVADAPVGPIIDADPNAPDASLPDASPPDASPPDATPPDASPPAAVGSPCANDAACGAGRICLDEGFGWSPTGFCTMTCTADVECGAGNVCSNPLGGLSVGFCFPDCMGGGSCTQPGLVCGQFLNGGADLGENMCYPGDTASVDGDACAGFWDCDANSYCATNPFDNPGGYCTQLGCMVGSASSCTSGGDAACITIDGTNVCADTCGSDSDCRVAEGYDCQSTWTSSFCVYVHQPTGAACTSAATCGEDPWECLTGPSFPGGYCGADACNPADANTCPGDAYCYDATPGSLDGTEYCAQVCGGDWECRQGAGYSCQSSQTAGINVCRL